MMRALAERHGGLLPLDTVEGIWRVIIGTFTYVQSSYSVHADISGGDAPMRDSARFHFGFTVPYVTPSERRGGDRGGGLLPRRSRHLPPRPGRDRAAPGGARSPTSDRPKIIARLPFIERPGHPAGTPVFVISKPLTDAAVRDVVLYAAQFERWHKGANEALTQLGGEVVASAADAHGLSELIAVPGSVEPAALKAALTKAGASLAQLAEIGSHAERFRVK